LTLAADETRGDRPTANAAGTPKTILDFDPPMAQFLVNLGAMPSVGRVAFRACERQLEVWVMLSPWSLKDEERVYRLDHEYRRTGGRGDIDVHVMPLDRVNEGTLPAVDFIIERAPD
jgi:hypothetical protein